MSKRDYRDVDGVLILDKPTGLSSNQALQRARRLYRARKAGHCGSLDPLATGVLPICFGQATRFAGYLLDAGKAYRATLRLGQRTNTGDAEGELIDERPVRVARDRLDAVLAGFSGEIEQVPPMYSALKHEGRRLYQLAREGREVTRPPRRVRIDGLRVVAFDAPALIVDVQCSKGTYVRSLAEDIGAVLGCGAHLSALRRTAVADFAIGAAHSLEELEAADDAARAACLLAADVLLAGYPLVELDAAACRDLGHGKRVPSPPGHVAGLCRLCARDGEFIGLGEIVGDGWIKAKRLMNTAR